jgi:hypothetical protein
MAEGLRVNELERWCAKPVRRTNIVLTASFQGSV